MGDMERRSRMASMRRKQRHMAEDRSMEFRAVKAENVRLRTALEEIAQMLGAEHLAGEPEGFINAGPQALRVARRALEEQPLATESW